MESNSTCSCNFMEQHDAPLEKLYILPCFPLDYFSNDHTRASIWFMSQELWLPKISILLKGVLQTLQKPFFYSLIIPRLKIKLWIDTWILLSNIFSMTPFFLNFEHQAESYTQLDIANLTLLYTFLPGVNNIKHQLFPLTEENISGNKKCFLWDTDNNSNDEFTTSLKLSNWCSSQNLQQSENDNFAPFALSLDLEHLALFMHPYIKILRELI